jgi:nucleoside-diphosphate-sugar epimerase
MPSSRKKGETDLKRVAVIGAAGYVGLELARQLDDTNLEVYAVARENGKFLLRNFEFNVISPADIRSIGTMDVVVNLAYPTSGPPQHYPTRNNEILTQIRALMGPATRLIHVSTQAVFGYDMNRPIDIGPVEMVRDYAYIEAKIELENLLIREFHSSSLQVVRLGNVWGPGSGAWTVALVNKILFGEPIGVTGVDGFCNATDVANAASYLSFLIDRDDLQGQRFYHLAEMSDHRWSEWITRIEAALGQESVRLSSRPAFPDNVKQEVREAISPIMPGPLYRNLIWSRTAGSRLRGITRRLGDQRFNQIKKRSAKALPSGYSPGPAEKMFLTIMSCETQFRTHVLPQWRAPVDFEESWSRVEAWMKSAGYSVNERQEC